MANQRALQAAYEAGMKAATKDAKSEVTSAAGKLYEAYRNMVDAFNDYYEATNKLGEGQEAWVAAMGSQDNAELVNKLNGYKINILGLGDPYNAVTDTMKRVSQL